MFDKLIESNTEQAEFKPRRKFFIVSSVVVGILFLSAVVASLYAQNIDLGTDNFDMAELLAPIAADVPEPEPPQQQPQRNNEPQESQLPSRQMAIERLDQSSKIPPAISSVPSEYLEMPLGRFELNPNGPDRNGSGGPVGPPTASYGSGGSSSEPDPEPVKAADPPPIAKAEPKKIRTQTKGVINGEAISLPKPPYPPAAKAINLSGQVDVQVLIDETGKVVSAKAVGGPLLLKQEAERAAWKAKFRPTFLGDDPVKVTGIIIYRFTR